jgi:hypothetical protein
MAELAITRGAEAQRLAGVGTEARDGGAQRDAQPRERRERRDAPTPELAVALGGDAVTIAYEEGPDGEPRLRVLDAERGETVAVLTPEELRRLTADTGLPPGLLMRVSS